MDSFLFLCASWEGEGGVVFDFLFLNEGKNSVALALYFTVIKLTGFYLEKGLKNF